ncbi:MAG TPA: hypothetical protein VJR26_09610 [Candidatus Acidoferrales bacterium]|nr:hypothetical protein [Candidatus Acidoferrales bacterium]
MKDRRTRQRKGRSGNSGYALFLALFIIAAMIVGSMAVLTDGRTEGRREREDQMIWRGNQVVRAIRAYYKRTGHYPQDLEALQKGVANIHFIRPEALVDPMDKDGDGKWRFIYTNPTGQIIGSVHYATMQQMALLDLYGGKIPGMKTGDSDSDQDSGGPGVQDDTSNGKCPPGTSKSTSSAMAQSATGVPGQLMPPSPAQTSPFNTFSLGNGPTTQAGANQSGCTIQAPGFQGIAPAALQALLKMKPTGPVDSPVIGGFLVGVGSTVDRKSVKVWKGGKKYADWEFIWNPIEDQARAIQQGLGGTPAGLGPGQGNGLPGPATTTTGGIGTSPIQAPPSGPQPGQPDQQ